MSLSDQEEERLKKIIAQTLCLKSDEIDFQKKRDDYEQWDSLKHLEVMLAIENEFKIRFSSTELTQTTEPDQIKTLVVTHLFEHKSSL
jgi:acyl carrier protein